MYTKDMKNRNRITEITYFVCLLLLAAMFCGCSPKKEDDGTLYFHHSLAEGNTQNSMQSVTEIETGSEENAYLITEIHAEDAYFMLYSCTDGLEYRYFYGTDTIFYDKYGGRMTTAGLAPGLLVTIGEVTTEGVLSSMQISDKAWGYDDVRRFSIDPELKMLKIADHKYRYDDSVHVFSGKKESRVEDIQAGDVLSVVGVDKQILSIRITTAQGTLKLKNTALFEGSFLQLGDKIFTEITPDLSLKVPEGKYRLTVANNGWGGSKEVKISRGKTTEVDLEELKGSGPKYGKIRFLIDEEDAVLLIDGKEKTVGSVLTIAYGKHSVAVYASGYDVWKRNLFVNSSEATLMISLKDEEEQKETEDSETSTQTKESQGTEKASQSTQAEQKSTYEKRKEELETVKDLISGMTNSSSLVSN